MTAWPGKLARMMPFSNASVLERAPSPPLGARHFTLSDLSRIPPIEIKVAASYADLSF
jgi:hypothetical protein